MPCLLNVNEELFLSPLYLHISKQNPLWVHSAIKDNIFLIFTQSQ